jgi:hypothetical protein
VDEGELPPPSFFKQDHLDGTSQVLGDEILAPSVAVVMPPVSRDSTESQTDNLKRLVHG